MGTAAAGEAGEKWGEAERKLWEQRERDEEAAGLPTTPPQLQHAKGEIRSPIFSSG